MKLPSFKDLIYTDYPQQFQSLIEQLSNSINVSMDGIINALNNNLNFEDNFLASISTVTISVNSSGTPTSTAAFTVDNTNPIDGLLIVSAINQTNSTTYPTSGVFISFTQSGNKVTINNITGLPPSNTFSIKIIALLT